MPITGPGWPRDVLECRKAIAFEEADNVAGEGLGSAAVHPEEEHDRYLRRKRR